LTCTDALHRIVFLFILTWQHAHASQDIPVNQARQLKWQHRSRKGAATLLLLYNTVVITGLLAALPLLLPLVIVSRKRRKTWLQRMGWWRSCRHSSHKGINRARLWVHGLSVGEVLAAQSLVEGIMARYPELQVVFTASTLTGFQTASRLFAGGSVAVAYFPYDLIWSVRAAADMIDARAVILVETDIWPNFLSEMNRRKTPVFMVNMRLSDNAWKNWRRFKWMAGKLFGAFEKICVQTQHDARRMIGLGVVPKQLCVTGNIKFDGVAMPADNAVEIHWRQQLQIEAGQPVIVAGSTHDGEEQLLLDALATLKRQGKRVCLILAPRDPDRTRMVLAMCGKMGLDAGRLSQVTGAESNRPDDVVIVDVLGVLKELYSLAHVAFVGGSLVEQGGHNPLEPAIFGKPVVFGPDMRDFRQIADWLLQSGGARQVSDPAGLVEALSEIVDNACLAASMGDRARQVVLVHQGAVARTMKFLNLTSYVQACSG
jgi:3-deoxy-D-manno-octulosonic-acid transferase